MRLSLLNTNFSRKHISNVIYLVVTCLSVHSHPLVKIFRSSYTLLTVPVMVECTMTIWETTTLMVTGMESPTNR